jgi:hypothetical protein
MSKLSTGWVLPLLMISPTVLALPLPRSVDSPSKLEIERQVGAENHPHVHSYGAFYRDGTYVLEYRDEYGKQMAEVYPPRGIPYSMQIDDPRWVTTYDSNQGRPRRGSATWELLRW